MNENNATNPRRSLLHQKVVLHVRSLIDCLWMLYLDPNLRTLIIKKLVSPFGDLPSSLPTSPAREHSPSLKPSAETGTHLQLIGPIPVTRDSVVGTRSPKVLSPLAPLTRKVGEAEAARAANRKEQLPVRSSRNSLSILPFGLSTAPREFTKTLAPVVQLVRSQGIQVHAYLDDWIIRASSRQQSLEHTQHVIQLLQSLGWTINWDKSMLQPSRIQAVNPLRLNVITFAKLRPTKLKGQM